MGLSCCFELKYLVRKRNILSFSIFFFRVLLSFSSLLSTFYLPLILLFLIFIIIIIIIIFFSYYHYYFMYRQIHPSPTTTTTTTRKTQLNQHIRLSHTLYYTTNYTSTTTMSTYILHSHYYHYQCHASPLGLTQTDEEAL